MVWLTILGQGEKIADKFLALEFDKTPENSYYRRNFFHPSADKQTLSLYYYMRITLWNLENPVKTVREREVKGIGLIPCRSALALPLRWVIASIAKLLEGLKPESSRCSLVSLQGSATVWILLHQRLFFFFRGCNLHLIVNWRGGGGGGRLLQLNCGRMEVTTTMQLGTFGFIAGLWGKSLCLNSFLLQWRKNATLVCACKDILFITGLGHSGHNKTPWINHREWSGI